LSSFFKKLGSNLVCRDERDLFPQAVRLVDEIRPQAVMLENVRGFLDAIFEDYRNKIKKEFEKLNYWVDLRLLNASDFGVSQLRPRVIFIAIQKEIADFFSWPEPCSQKPLSVGNLLFDLITERSWKGALQWCDGANQVAPTLVGGSRKHGGPDLGPTRSKKAWAALGVDGNGIADLAPEKNFVGMPRLTTKMAARVQGFPDSWQISGKKTAAYRQIGNAFPPPVAKAVGEQLKVAFNNSAKKRLRKRVIGSINHGIPKEDRACL